jgi:hypothetical protein
MRAKGKGTQSWEGDIAIFLINAGPKDTARELGARV